jgi:hypothetical protein
MKFPLRRDTHKSRRTHRLLTTTAAALLAIAPVTARATDIRGVQPASLDQPRVNAILRYPAGNVGVSDPLYADDPFFGGKFFNIQAFYDTGASGILLSTATADMLQSAADSEPGIHRQTYNNQTVTYEDVGVAGSDAFNVSVPVHIQIAHFHPDNDQRIADAEEEFSNTGSATNVNSIYKQSFGPLRTQIGPINSDPDPTLEGLDVFGMPAMKGKVIVMDPRPVDSFLDTMRTYTYDPGTAFNKPAADTDPGIPNTTRTVKLSYGSFDQFTKITPAGAPGPTLEHNPFIGPNPVNPAGDSTPPVKLTYGTRSTSGSFLLDTGAAASMISQAKAADLGITPNYDDPDNPYLVGVPRDEQFTLTIGGIGGSRKVAGFFLSSMLVRTQEGNAANDNDPKHIRFIDAPVLVNDITLKNPSNGNELTLDGIFGTNFLVASAFVSEGGIGGLPIIGDLTPGAFDWVVFDEPSGLLKLRPRLPGDANRDGTVDFEDLVALAQHYNTQTESETPWNDGDFNGDNQITFEDLVALAQHYGLSDLNPGDILDLPHYDLGFGAPAANGQPVPEPATFALLAIAAALITPRRKRLARA